VWVVLTDFFDHIDVGIRVEAHDEQVHELWLRANIWPVVLLADSLPSLDPRYQVRLTHGQGLRHIVLRSIRARELLLRRREAGEEAQGTAQSGEGGTHHLERTRTLKQCKKNRKMEIARQLSEIKRRSRRKVRGGD
jgi:hypothetical protein